MSIDRAPARPRLSLNDHKADLINVKRRLLLRGGLSLGAVSLLSGCSISDNESVETALGAISRFNDRV